MDAIFDDNLPMDDYFVSIHAPVMDAITLTAKR